MRPFFLMPALLALAACTTPVAAPVASEPVQDGKDPCNAAAVQSYVGRKADAATVESARKAANANMARVLVPGQMVTMEYREGRLNVHVDGANTIVRITCG